MPSRADRMRGTIWGQFVGDAACVGAHWIYDPEEIARRWPGGLRGFETPWPGHHHARRRSGDLTHYGDMALLLLESLVERNGFDAADFGRRFIEAVASPEYMGYRDKAMKGTLARYEAYVATHGPATFDHQQGAEDFEPATVSRLAPLVVAGLSDENVVDRHTRVTQDHPRALIYARYHARVLCALVDGHALADAFALATSALPTDGFGEELRVSLARVRGPLAGADVTDATRTLGQHCRLDQSLPAAIHAALSYPTDLRAAVLATARAGGDSAGRGAMIGAWLGASLGVGGVPAEWRTALAAHERIAALVERLVARA
ncbi:MAG TPA: ADP-ribosylglycohydrolase family protein [Candidatus Limnocylindria bacterium]|nr:ADP-ribosylglycohydrolase family protein [Candidatus Limnocylindria bacterium]